MSLSPPSDEEPLGGGGEVSGGSGGGSEPQQQQRQPPARRPSRRRNTWNLNDRGQGGGGGGGVHSSMTDFYRPRRATGRGGVHSSLTTGGSSGRYRRPPILPRRGHSIRFRRESSDSFDESSQSHSEGDLEVMDLRPRRHRHGSDVSSSLVSLGSLSSIDSKDNCNRSSLKLSARYIIEHGIINEHGSMIQVASGHGLNMFGGSGDGNGFGSDGCDRRSGSGGDTPKHWDEAKSPPEGNSQENGKQEQLRRPGDSNALEIRRMSTGSGMPSLFSKKSLDNIVSNVSSSKGEDKINKRASLSMIEIDRSGMLFSDAGSIANDSEIGDGSYDGSAWTETSPLTETGVKQQERSSLIFRHCIRAMSGFVVLAALVGSVIFHFFSKEERKLLLESLLEYNLLGRLFNNAGSSETSTLQTKVTAIN
mmetsp:Transcript_54978/g.116850  ORF Transcript_54978/g.116850 Transcript_54978/m.116850 type:complete len:421 (+) Transcript_54978:82-1344(+)